MSSKLKNPQQQLKLKPIHITKHKSTMTGAVFNLVNSIIGIFKDCTEMS